MNNNACMVMIFYWAFKNKQCFIAHDNQCDLENSWTICDLEHLKMLIHGKLNVHDVRFLCAQGQQKFFCLSDEQSLLMNTINMFK